jgi:hypothetical protein
MNDPNPQSTRTEACSPLRRLFAARHLPKYLFAAVCIATLSALFLVVQNRRESQTRPNDSDTVPARAERAVAKKFFPPAVADDQNFAATPFFASLFPKPRRDQSDDWPDDFSRADQWPRRWPTLANSAEGRKTGRFITDLVAWRKAFEQSQSITGTDNEEIIVSEAPDAAANAQAAVAVLAALKPYEPVLAELHAANQRPRSRFNVHWDEENPWAILLPHLAVVKRTCQLLRLKTSAELAAGQADPALRDALLMVRLVDSPKEEPTLISQLVCVACLNIAIQPIWEGLAERRWSEGQLESLQARLQQFDFLTDLKRVLEAERAFGNLTIGLVRDKRTPNFLLSLISTGGKVESWQEEADRAFVTCPRDWFDQEQRNYSRFFDERLLTGLDVAARRVHPRVADDNARYLEHAMPKKDKLLKEHLVFAEALLVAPGKVHLKLANAQATADLAAIACALERHRLANGRYPDTLAALTPRFIKQLPHDIVDGQPLRYQRTSDGQFLLYSVGWNETDDDGQIGLLASGRGTEIKDGDWTWRYPATK